MEYLAPMGHTIAIPPGVLGTVERGIRGADEIFLMGHVRRTGASDTKTDGNVDHLLVMDKTILLDLFSETNLPTEEARPGRHQIFDDL